MGNEEWELEIRNRGLDLKLETKALSPKAND